VPITFSTLEHVIQRIAEEQWKNEPGGPMPRLRLDSWGLLHSALVQPFQRVGGREVYPALIPKAAVLFRGLVKNHGLVDGNKRMGVTATGLFLMVNGYQPAFTAPELRDYALEVAGHPGNYSVRKIERWLRPRAKLLSPSDLKKLRAIIQAEIHEAGDPLDILFSETPPGSQT
jgi:death-on-curing protein